MKINYLKDKWIKLDNMAKIFSLDDRRNTNIFRYSVLLKKNIDSVILQDALNLALMDYPRFKVKIGSGLFWNYLEYNSKKLIVKKESGIPCEHINFRRNNDYLFKVTYYKNKINLDLFHVLTDGSGAIVFLKALIYHYLNLKYKLSKNVNNNEDIYKHEDLNLKYYDKNYKMAYDFKAAYQLPGKVNKRINNTYHYIVSVDEIKEVCKEYNVTITQYLTSVYIYAMYLSIYNRKSNKEISITVPIDLRKFFNDNTLANFFTYMNIVSNGSKKDKISFDEVLNHIRDEFKRKLTNDKIKAYLARDVKLGMNIPIRLVPLFIKKLFIKFMGVLVTKSCTSTLSNVGIIDIEQPYKKYINNILVLVMPSKLQKIKCSVCSYDNNLNITINSNIKDIKFQRAFFEILDKNIKKIKIESNKRVKKWGEL